MLLLRLSTVGYENHQLPSSTLGPIDSLSLKTSLIPALALEAGQLKRPGQLLLNLIQHSQLPVI